MSFLEFGYFCTWSHAAFCTFLEIMVPISDFVRSFLTKLFLKCKVFSQNNNTQTQLVQHTACACLYFITQTMQKNGVKRKNKINNLATHRTYNTVHDLYHCAIY
jgi:hypothetical protein